MLVLEEQGSPLRSEQDALDLIAVSADTGDSVIVVPVSRLDPDFFDLSTGVAGAFVQKFVTNRKRLVVLGGIGPLVAASGALGDWVRESNRGTDVWFVPTMAELRERVDE